MSLSIYILLQEHPKKKMVRVFFPDHLLFRESLRHRLKAGPEVRVFFPLEGVNGQNLETTTPGGN